MKTEVEVRFKISEELIKPFMFALRLKTSIAVCKEALSLLKWAIIQKQKGYQIVAINPKSNNHYEYELIMASLENVEKL